jgi:hypothetical protein
LTWHRTESDSPLFFFGLLDLAIIVSQVLDVKRFAQRKFFRMANFWRNFV